MNSNTLIDELIIQTELIINQAEKLKAEDLTYLTWKENSETWCKLECLKHLNLYGDYYLPQIEKKIKQSKTQFEMEFKSGILGNYFANSMLPKEKLNKMKTFKNKNPLNSHLEKGVIDEFIAQQNRLIDLMKQSKKVSLNKVKIETSLSKWLKFKLGDTFRFIVNHNIRHMKQIERIEFNQAR